MHPDLMRELANQRGREMRAKARQVKLARRMRKERRVQRGSASAQ